jgi:DNA repair protein RecO (recombination protein O)
MLHKTRGIVFHVTDYSETSVVARIYTEVFGIQSYLLKGAKRKKNKLHSGILQPMSLLEMEVYHKDHGGLQYATELNNNPPFTGIPYDMVKSSIVLFLNEIAYKSIREEEGNPLLFDFLHHTMLWLDAMDPVHPDFHLVFMVQLTRFLGFFRMACQGNDRTLTSSKAASRKRLRVMHSFSNRIYANGWACSSALRYRTRETSAYRGS